MRRDFWKEIDRLFERALDLTDAERRSFLDELRARDEELGAAVEELLRAAEASGPFLEAPVGELCTVPWDTVFEHEGGDGRPKGVDRSGERIGSYRLVRRIGRGGMATVYLAERADGLWEQEVALKLIRRGFDSEDVVRRFLAERQILSSLRHPNIASLLDGGTTADGLPYLVMEYVEGIPITGYCDERELSVDTRLRLFCEVGRAVQHAHRNLVVHRDLKPSNILVTEERRAKLLDFGIAKLLEADAASDAYGYTRPGRRPLTPEYASPEQLAGGPITAASDVYQLGVLLYRLLCGRSPHGGARTWPLLDRRRRENDVPEPPSQALTRTRSGGETDPEAADLAAARGTGVEELCRKLRGDLDTIVEKALRPEPGERYDSAAALVEDVERHLEQLPIRARSPTRRYRLRKFLKRNAWVGPVAAATLLAAGVYAVTMDRQARALERERNVARAEAERAEAIQSFMTGLFDSADPLSPAPGDPGGSREVTVVEALEIGTERARKELADRPALQADVLGAIADVYARLDLSEPAVRLRREALQHARSAYGPSSPEVADRLRKLGNSVADADSAERLLRAALRLTEEHHGRRDTAYANVLVSLGHGAINGSRYEEAADHLEAAVSILETAEPPAETQLAAALGALAEVYPHLSRTEEAVEVGRRSLEHFRRTLGEDHPRTAMAMVHLATAYDGIGESKDAVELYRSALPIMDGSLGVAHTETLSTRNNLAVSLLRAGELERAEEELRRIVEILTDKHGERHPKVASAFQNLAATLNRMGEVDEADAALRRARDIYVDVLGPDDYRTALPLLTLSEIQLEREDFAGAEASASEATRTLRRTLPEGHFATAVAECRWGRALAGLGRTDRARPLLEGAARTLRTPPGPEHHRRACLEAAVEHFKAVGAASARWAPFAESLRELEEEATVTDGGDSS